MFSNKDLRNLIVPFFLEQLLMALVGMADVFVVGFLGEAAVSGVSLINAFNMIFMNLFTALAAGGAVVISQYIGRKDNRRAGEAVSQLLLAVYNAGAALYRSFGKTSTTMYLSIASNIINVVGNCIGVFWLHAGVAGVAWPSLLARMFSAVVITFFCFSEKNPVRYGKAWIFRLDGSLQKIILRIAVPNGIESGIFQLVKVALSSVAALFGTYQIAANGVAQSIWSVASLVASTMGPVFITVIGQCMGAGDISQAEQYFRKLTKITVGFALLWNSLIFAATPVLLRFYALEPQTKQLILILVLLHNLFSALAFPFADPLGKGLRAAGDVRFTTVTSLFTTIGVRLVFSILFAIVLQMGVVGIACAMCLDWVVRGVIFWLRFRQGKWKDYRVI